MFYEIDVAKMTEAPNLRPLRDSPDDLYQEFLEAQEKYLQTQLVAKQHPLDEDLKDLCQENAFDLANEFENLTNAHLQVLVNLKAKRSLTELDSQICKRLEVMLKEERNSWRLAKALFKDYLVHGSRYNRDPNRMDDSGSSLNINGASQMNHDERIFHPSVQSFSEDQLIGNLFVENAEIRRMQLVIDWLEANESDELDYKDEEDKAEFYSEGPIAWENTFHTIRARSSIAMHALDITNQSNSGVELCSAMDPDAPVRTKTSLVHADKEVEVRLFKHLFRFMRAGKLVEGQELAQRVGYHWLAGILDGYFPYSDPNLDEENLGQTAIHQTVDIRPVLGNKKRDIWKKTCYRSARMHGLSSFEKAILGVSGGNVKSVLPVCTSWSDQLWARLKCSIDIKIEKALRDPGTVPQENRKLIEFPAEFYDGDQDIQNIFKSINVVSSFREATIHQTVQKLFIFNDIDGLLDQLVDWCKSLDYGNDMAVNNEALSPQFLRFFAHVVLFLRELEMIATDDPRGSEIIKSYLDLLTQRKFIETVAFYTTFLPKDSQVIAYAHMLASINNLDERKHCLKIAEESKLDVDEITQTVVGMLTQEQEEHPSGVDSEINKTTASDRRKIDSLDYLLYSETKNYIAVLHHGNILLRLFATSRKMDAVKDTFLKLPTDLTGFAEKQWTLITNDSVSPSLQNNIREFNAFRVLLETNERLLEWSDWHLKKPEEPKKPANLLSFCDNVNFEKKVQQYHNDKAVWKEVREGKTDALIEKIREMFNFPHGWMVDLPTNESQPNEDRLRQMSKLRKIFIPQMTSICLNVLQLTERYEECLRMSHLLVDEKMKLYREFSKDQLRDFLDKMSEITKIIVRKNIVAQANTDDE